MSQYFITTTEAAAQPEICPCCGCYIEEHLGPNERADILGLVEWCECENGPEGRKEGSNDGPVDVFVC